MNNMRPPPGWNPQVNGPWPPQNRPPFDPRNQRPPQTPMKGPGPWNQVPQTPGGKPPGFAVPNMVKPERGMPPTAVPTATPTTTPQVQATPTPTATTSNMQEATVYKLTMPGSNLEGEQFFVELQAYANLREERDRLNQTTATLKEEKERLAQENQNLNSDLANKSGASPETSELMSFLNNLKETLLTKKEGEDPNQKFLTIAQDIVRQNKTHIAIVELSKKILLQEEEKNSAKVDSGWMKSMSEKITELEERNKSLEANNASVKQAYANLTNES